MEKNHSLRIGMLLPRLLSLKITMVDKVFTTIGLTHTAWAVLMSISRFPGQSTHALAEMSFVTDQSFGQMVAKLAKQGLVDRKPSHGRAILHELTPKGQATLAAAEPLISEAIQGLFSVLNSEETKQLADLIERVVVYNGNEKMLESVQAAKVHLGYGKNGVGED